MVGYAVNPGGMIDPDQVVGRDDLIRECWRYLQHKSIALVAPRRMGKTSIVRRMVANAPDTRRALSCDLEKFKHPADLVETVYRDCEDLLSVGKRTRHRLKEYLHTLIGDDTIKGIKLGVAPQNWASMLDAGF